jgi:uncharacterized protein YfeS
MTEGPNFQEAHPIARRLMDEDFYYSPIEESGPFGSDDGADTMAGFTDWRAAHPTDDPLIYLQQQLDEWGYPPFDLQEDDPIVIRDYLEAGKLNISYLVGMDAAIVALAFGQLYLEGRVEASLRTLAIISLSRQLQPELLQLWDESYQLRRKEQLEKMKSVLHRV